VGDIPYLANLINAEDVEALGAPASRHCIVVVVMNVEG
jgi:hypothetical protein